MTPTRVGYIEFLNSIPVYHGIESGAVRMPAGVELVRGKPSELNAKLLAGELLASPISSVEYARHAEELVLLPDLSINSHGFIDSVTLFSAGPVEELAGQRILVTDASATGHALLAVLLAKHFRIGAHLERGRPDLSRIGTPFQAALLIGDEALHAGLARPDLVKTDLGEEWRAFSGYPMVFALWAARRDTARSSSSTLRAVHDALKASKRWGAQHPEEIVKAAQARSGLPGDLLVRYFRNLNYDLDARKILGLRRFFELALDVGQVPRVPELSLAEVKVPWT